MIKDTRCIGIRNHYHQFQPSICLIPICKASIFGTHCAVCFYWIIGGYGNQAANISSRRCVNTFYKLLLFASNLLFLHYESHPHYGLFRCENIWRGRTQGFSLSSFLWRWQWVRAPEESRRWKPLPSQWRQKEQSSQMPVFIQLRSRYG